MAAKQVKPVTPPVAADSARLTRIAELVDLIGTIEPQVAPVTPKIRKLEEARAELRKLCEDLPPENELRAEGSTHWAILGPRARKRLIDYPKLWKRAGVATMKEIATVTLDAIKTALGEEALASVTHEELTGPRSIKVFARGEETRS